MLGDQRLQVLSSYTGSTPGPMCCCACCACCAAFYDGPMLVTSLKVVKNFVALGDAQHSVQFVRYTDEVRGTLLVV